MELDSFAQWLAEHGLPGYQSGFRHAGYETLSGFLAAAVGREELLLIGVPRWAQQIGGSGGLT
jgi:hypothetical protein